MTDIVELQEESNAAHNEALNLREQNKFLYDDVLDDKINELDDLGVQLYEECENVENELFAMIATGNIWIKTFPSKSW